MDSSDLKLKQEQSTTSLSSVQNIDSHDFQEADTTPPSLTHTKFLSSPASSSTGSASTSTLTITDQQSNLSHSPEITLAPDGVQDHIDNEAPDTVHDDHEEKKDQPVPSPSTQPGDDGTTLPLYDTTNVAGAKRGVWSWMKLSIRPHGESGRAGFHPLLFFRIMIQSSSRISMMCNILWPLVPVAIALRWTESQHNQHLLAFIFSYLAILPCANFVGFTGSELARKLPHIAGILIFAAFESVTEIILIMVLLTEQKFVVIKAAILGSILATMLLCLGLCFFFAGLRHTELCFDDHVTEAVSGILFVGAMALAVPTLYYHGLLGTPSAEGVDLASRTLQISRGLAILLLGAYIVYVIYQTRTLHDGIFETEALSRRKHSRTRRLTLTECIVGVSFSIGLVTVLSIGLVNQISYVVDHYNISDPFIGLILVPLLEKSAEHFTAVEEACDNKTNLALSHVLNATVQTALFTAPLAVIIAWGRGMSMDLNFDVFHIVMLILAVVAVGNFMRDQKANYLEGFLCIVLYAAIALAAYFYPNDPAGH